MTDVSNEYLKVVSPQSPEEFEAEMAVIENTPYDDSGDTSPINLNIPEITVTNEEEPPINHELTGSTSKETDTDWAAGEASPEREVSGVGGYAADIGYGVAKGVIDAGTEINHTLANVADFLVPDAWRDDPDYFTKLAEEYSPRIDESTLELVGLKAPASVVGQTSKSIAQFMTGFVPALKAVRGIKAIGSTSKAANALKTGVGVGGAGAIADLSVFNPYEERLSNMAIESGIPGFDNALTQYLAADEDDSELLGRVKQTAEGYVVGKVLEPLVALIGATKKAKTVYKAEQGMQPPAQTTGAYTTNPLNGEVVQVTMPDNIPPKWTLDNPTINLPSEEIQKDFAYKYLDGDLEGAAERASGLVNLKYLNTEEGIRDMIEGFAVVKNNAVAKNTRGWQEASGNAGKLGVDAIPQASARVADLDSFVIAAEETRAAVAYRVRDLARQAKANPSSLAQAEFEDALHKLFVIDAMTTNNKSEIARAMKAMQRPVTGSGLAKGITANLKDMTNTKGNANWKLMMDMVADLPDSNSVTRMARAATLPNWKDAATEVYINGLFSPKTFAVNAVSNTLSMASIVGERYLGAARSQLVGSGELTFMEANRHAIGMLKGISDGVTAFSQAWKTNSPIMGEGNKFLETNQMKGFQAASFGISDESTPLIQKLGKGLDLTGTVLRSLPGGTRSLMASDEFYKAMFYRAELSGLAVREAHKAGLKKGTPEFSAMINDVLEGAKNAKVGEPYYGVNMASQEAAFRGTFTEELGEAGTEIVKGIRKVPMSYAILPFVKTPTNLVKYMYRRTPGLAGTSDYVAAELAAGGARADLAEAQISAGAMYLTTGLLLAGGGYMRGAMTDNPAARSNLNAFDVEQEALVNPESDFQLGVGRLDGNPISFLLLAATTHETVMAYVEANQDELTPEELEQGIMEMMAIPLQVATKFASNQSWVQGMTNFTNAIQRDSEGDYIQKTLGNLVPAGNTLKWLNRQTQDPYLREASDALEEMRAKIPGMSRSLPPRPDLLGNPVNIANGDFFGISPVSMKVPLDHPVMNELTRLQTLNPNEVMLGGVPKVLGDVKLDPTEKWNYMQFVRQLKDGSGMDLVDRLNEIIMNPAYERLTDSQKNEKLKDLYNSRKDMAEKAIQYDTVMFYQGLPRPYAEEYDLYDYKRMSALADKVSAKEVTKATNKFGAIGMSWEEYIDKKNDAIARSNLGINF